MRRPSPATLIALVALFFSMSGVAYAATGGNFILGKANSAKAVTSLTNKNGTALSLSSAAADPPLTVGNSVQVPNLNASELDGQSSSSFLPASGTAANSNELGGQPASSFLPVTGTAANSNDLGGTPASGYMHGGGNAGGSRVTTTGSGATFLLTTPGVSLISDCDPNGNGSGAALLIETNSGTNSGASAVWWNKDGVNTAAPLVGNALTPGLGSTTPYVVTGQVDNITSILSFTATERYNSGTDACSFTAQIITTNG
jgi:hypothetical protein